ncbi:MAG: dockerin type I domain-containing protein [Saprospiraceae bacterium]|nr:dockerin type I domain-containing protein [Saprospiraceae bacterium]
MRTFMINQELKSARAGANCFRLLPRNLWLLPLLAALVAAMPAKAQTPVIYLGTAPGAPATCNCLNNATTLTNGQFSDQITIEAPAGQTWTVVGVSGFFSTTSPAPPAAPTPIPAGTPIPETAAGSGVYEISVLHVDGIGFLLTVGNGVQMLSIGSTCHYPNPQIVGLSNQYCTSSAPVTLTGNAGGAAGTGSFSVNGLPATVFNPLQAGPGSYTIRYTFNAGTGTPGNAGDPACSAYVEQVVTVLEAPNIATNNLVNVTLNANCSTLITPDMILEGDYPCIDQDYVVTVFDQFGNAIGNTVNSAHVGQTLLVRVATVAGGFFGLGNIYITDPLPPTVACPPNTNATVIAQQIQFLQGSLDANSSSFIPLNFSCLSPQVSPAIGQHYFRLDTFTVTQNDLYVFELDATYGRGLGGIYEGIPAFFNGPCLSLLSVSNLPLPGMGYFSDSTNVVRIAIQLQAGQVYSILTSTFEVGATGTFRWAVYSAGNGRLSGRPVTNGITRSKLFCTDAASLINIAGSIQFTGAPVTQDNCSAQPVVTFTDQVTSNGICGNTLINRQFTVRDGANNLVQCTQTITVGKASSPDIVFPAKSVLVACDASLQTTPDGNPSPIVTGRPLVYSAFGVHYLDSPFCNLIASFGDQPRTSTCQGNYQFIRRWYIFDDCNPAGTLSYDQVIRVADTTPPIITTASDTTYYSTGWGVCTASFGVPLPIVTDNCSNSWQILTEVLTEVPVQILNEVGQVVGTILQTQVLTTFPNGATNRTVSNIPIGCHRIRYTVTDACGNSATKIMTFCVRDQALPTAVCDDQLMLSLGGSVGTLLASDVDEGSNDPCGLASIQVRRMIAKDPVTCQPVTPYYTDWGPSVQFYCCDAGATMHTELRATDLHGNQNVCITQITIEDNSRPTCVAPNAVNVLCSNLPVNFNPNNLAQLNTLFGAPAAEDNCAGATAEELSPVVTLNLCGSGTITRRFRASDAFGNASLGTCQQQVTIQPSNIYNIKLPKDLSVNCVAPAPDTAQMIALGCDRFSLSVQDLQISAPGEACYKIFRTYHIINHCEYNGSDPAIEISRDEDCDGVPGDEDVWILRRASGIVTDRDNDPVNAIPAAGTRGPSCPGGNNPAGYWREVVASNGYWTYTQVIKVQNNVPPVISVNPGGSSFCSFDNNTCLGEATAAFTVQQSCQTGPVVVKVFIDLGRNGSLDQEVTATALFGTYPNYNIRANYPIGQHAFVVRVEDACGNQAQSNIPFLVNDCVAAAPICLTNLSVVLQPLLPGIDIDGDGDADGGFAVLPAVNFIGSPVTENCSGPIRYSIHRSQDVLNGIDLPNPSHDSLLLTCDDEGIILVRLYAWDNAYNPLLQQPNGTIGGSNYTFCEAFLTIQDNQPEACGGFLPTTMIASVAGLIISESGEPVEGVSLRPTDTMPVMDTTGVDGVYELDDLETGHEYTIRPQRPGDWMNGVSTIDLVLISRHILGTQLLNSPYKLIAADANGSGSVTTLDVVLLRKLILGISTELPNVPSWRFVDANYAFPNAMNPWQENFPQVISLSNLSSDLANEDFIAVKTGDINGSAQFNFQQAENRNTRAPFVLQAAGKMLEPGDICHLTLKAPGIEGLEGLQGTLQFDADDLELIGIENGILQEEHLGSKELLDGLLTFSWNWLQEAGAPDSEVLITLVFRANNKIDMGQAFTLHSGITKAEAYDEADQALPLSLVFLPDAAPGNRIELYQNRPNPFRDETTIGFNLPAASQVRLVVSDLSGKTVWELNGYYDAGKHEVEFQAERQLAAGVLLYRIEALGHTATGKMVRID